MQAIPVLLVGGVRFLQGVSLFGDGYVLSAHFETADGVVKGTPVTIRGISVGRVEDVNLGTAGRLLNDPQLCHRTDTLTVRLNRILKDFEENPGRYVSLEVF